MSEALFALAGAVLGVLGTIATEMTRARREDRRTHRGALRLVCANFTTAITRMRQLSKLLRHDPDDNGLRAQVQEAHDDAQMHYERLRLTADSLAAQEAGRHVLHHSYWHWKAAEGRQIDPSKHSGSHRVIDEWLVRLYVEVRRELGLAQATNVYEDPAGGIRERTVDNVGNA